MTTPEDFSGAIAAAGAPVIAAASNAAVPIFHILPQFPRGSFDIFPISGTFFCRQLFLPCNTLARS